MCISKHEAWPSVSAPCKSCCISRRCVGNTSPNAVPPLVFRFCLGTGIRCAPESWLAPWCFSVFQNTLKAVLYFGCHRHHPCAAACFGIFDHIFPVSRSLKLMIHNDKIVFKINIIDCQAHKLRNTKSRLKENGDTIIILAEMLKRTSSWW